MAIYRGPGGPGDATGDAANAAQLANEYATEAASSAAAAALSAIAAQLAETNAETAETNAETAETNAASSASAASTSATNASSSASAAATSATNASNSASAAATSATNASNSASAAATSATNASNSASSAATSATNASNSASAAATSETNAANSATSAANSYDAFDDRYLGAKAANPTLDNDGNALLTGALYFNTVSNSMKVYTGSSWIDGYASGALIASNNLSDLTNTTTARTNLGLGSIATQAASNVSITGGSITGITDIAVADGGTGVSTLTANNVILGNGTSSVQFVAPGTTGNVLTSNGTTWTSSAAGSGGQFEGTATDKAIAWNAQTIAENITIVGTHNAMSVGPITINSGYAVTVNSGARWVVL